MMKASPANKKKGTGYFFCAKDDSFYWWIAHQKK
jgi:hypothetical protein